MVSRFLSFHFHNINDSPIYFIPLADWARGNYCNFLIPLV